MRVSVNNLIPTAGMYRKTITTGIAATVNAPSRDICWIELGGVEISSFEPLKIGWNKTLENVEKEESPQARREPQCGLMCKTILSPEVGPYRSSGGDLLPTCGWRLHPGAHGVLRTLDVYTAGSARYCTALRDWVPPRGGPKGKLQAPWSAWCG